MISVCFFFQKPSQNSKSKTAINGHLNEDSDALLFNQYVKKPGFAYYRDLAGRFATILVHLSFLSEDIL